MHWILLCKIIAPNDLLHPIIQTHVKTANGIRTIAPLGNWEDMIFSKEMDNAVNMDINLKSYEVTHLNLSTFSMIM